MLQPDKNFLGKPAPPNYVAGLGRGATGFTTRTDIGPARESGLADKLPGQERGDGDLGGDGRGGDDSGRFQDPDDDTGLFNTGPYEQDDEEADQIWESIEQQMDERRKKRREAQEKENIEQMKEQNPVISEQFTDLKRQLSHLSEGEWMAIPEATNISGKRRKKEPKMERFSAVPDSLLLADFREIGKARDKVLEIKLDQAGGDSVSGKTTIDPRGYLTSLNSSVVMTASDIGDIQKARQLLKSVTMTNPKHAPGWIAAARLEKLAGKMGTARSIIAKGCEECPKNEDIWMEASQLNTKENAKVILASAVRHLPKSVPIWLAASELEDDVKSKRRVFRRGLEFIPTSVQLWKAAISIEEPENAKVLLSRSVELIPASVDLWLALAKLETYENAQKVLNKARAAVPTSHEIWFAAAQLEEQQGHNERVYKIIHRAVLTLAKKGIVFDRERWLNEAVEMEERGYLEVCRSIIRAVANVDLEEENKADVWISEAERQQEKGHIECSRALFALALTEYPSDPDIWMSAAILEQNSGTLKTLIELLERAVKECPQDDNLWLMMAKTKWRRANDLDGARSTLMEALKANPDSESIWLAAVKIEVTEREYPRAQKLLQSTRKTLTDSAKVWMKSAVLERNLGNNEEAYSLVTQALEKWQDFPKLWMIKAQLEDKVAARATLSKAVKMCPDCIPLWCMSARLEPSIKARAILERCRVRNPKSDELWLESIAVERQAGNDANARTLLNQALRECPSSGLLWSEAIQSEKPQGRKSKSADAMKHCEKNAYVVCSVGRLLWQESKIDKAKRWFEKAVEYDPSWGDGWGYLYKFESTEAGTNPDSVIERCIKAEPRYGKVWQAVAKDPANFELDTKHILLLVASKLD